MTAAPRFLVLCASTRPGSLNRRLAETAAHRLESEGAEVRLVDLDDYAVPLYRGGIELVDGIAEGARRFAADLERHDGLVLVSPEYNHSMPGALKNLLDWVSRIKPWPTSEVPALLMSASPGALGGARGLAALRITLASNGMHVLDTEFALPAADRALTGHGFAEPEEDDRLDAAVKALLAAV
ncbi:NADPH-dependent FMN reductase [Glycomyces terrestris]|uniref:NADPH-dependent oxidoreductase n=1 Tax=Glycomyces terrestris TaxID=2493553 RepID=A0A426V3Y6_9ACTN|nr:NAD(P)H-dependent oxidoreductase [Glycomyces terrestris]RRS01541.1 NADPH-dependent oxidoreductase [Glycomyces terrestris]